MGKVEKSEARCIKLPLLVLVKDKGLQESQLGCGESWQILFKGKHAILI